MEWDVIAREVTGVITTALPYFAILIGLVMGIPLAWRLIRRIVR